MSRVALVVMAFVLSACSGSSPTAPSGSALLGGPGTLAVGPPAVIPPAVEGWRGRPDVPGPPPGVPTPHNPPAPGAIAYDEAASGDLPADGSLTSVGVLGLGNNTISGTSFFVAGSGFDFDAFTFDVPAGLSITGVSYAWTLTPIEGPVGELFSAEIEYGLSSGSGSAEVTVLLFDNAGTSSGTVQAFQSLMPAGPGTYGLTTTGDGMSGLGAPGESLGWSASYTWTVVVE